MREQWVKDINETKDILKTSCMVRKFPNRVLPSVVRAMLESVASWMAGSQSGIG